MPRWQVLDPLDGGTLSFLRRTYVLEELVPSLCDHVLGRTDSAPLAVYRKLGVTSRDEAVTRARQLGLVESPIRD